MKKRHTETFQRIWSIDNPSCKCLCSTEGAMSELNKSRDHFDAADQGIELR